MGVLVEIAQSDIDRPPYDPSSFDLAILVPGGSLPDDDAIGRAVVGARAVVRDGGRCLVVDEVPRGVSGLLGRKAGGPDTRGNRLVHILAEHGCRAARVLAEREGLLFVEAIVKH
jgi:hypothetical protein